MGNMFDLNGDGRMSANERAYEHYVYDSINKDSSVNSSSSHSTPSSKKKGISFGELLACCCIINLFFPQLEMWLILILIGYGIIKKLSS